jgi:hypothetical protein
MPANTMRKPLSELSIPSSGQSSHLVLTSFRSSQETPPTTVVSKQDHRWSDVVPPNSALTFSAIWDSKEGMIAFSVSELQDSPEHESTNLPLDILDDCSQILTIAQSVAPSENTATLAVFRDTYLCSGAATPIFNGRPLASSTWGGFDVCLRHSRIAVARRCSRYYSCFDALDDELGFDPRTAFSDIPVKFKNTMDGDSVTDEGFYEGGNQASASSDDDLVLLELNLSSAFSTTTTSTSNYVDVEGDAASDTWSALETPVHLSCPNSPPSNLRRRLRKRRYADPAPPVEVLAREQYNYADDHPTLLEDEKKRILPKFVRSLGKWKRGSSTDDRWVCVEVTQKITQHYE